MDCWETALAEWVIYLRACGRAETTITTRTAWVRLFARAPLTPRPSDVTSEHVLAWMADQDWSPNTRRSARASLRAFFDRARLTGVRADNPCDQIPPVRVPPPLPRPAPEARYAAAIAAAADRRVELALLLAGHAGLRRGEIARARREDLDETGLWVRGKGGRMRVVPVPPRIGALIVGSPPGWLLPARWGDGHMHVDAVGKMIRRAMGGLGPHALRHRFATRAYGGTKDLRAVQTLLGHSSPATTAVYIAVSGESLVAAVAAAA